MVNPLSSSRTFHIISKRNCYRWFEKHGLIRSFPPASDGIVYPSHKLWIIICLFPATQLQSNYDLRHNAETSQWKCQCFDLMTLLLQQGLEYSGCVCALNLWIPTYDLGFERVENTHSTVSQWVIKESKKIRYQIAPNTRWNIIKEVPFLGFDLQWNLITFPFSQFILPFSLRSLDTLYIPQYNSVS